MGDEMNEYRDKLMAWQPGAAGFSRDDTILAVGLQCRKGRFPLADVLTWLGTPDRATGNSAGGHLVYFYSGDAEIAPIFDVSDGRVVEFGTIARFKPNAIRPDAKTHFNVLDEMEPFDEAVFMLNATRAALGLNRQDAEDAKGEG